MPALFMLHERKLRNTHQKLVEILADKVPAMNDSNCVLVTDRGEAFNVYILFEERFPQLNKVHCWNHVLSAAKQWLRNHNASSGDVQVYVDHIRTLLHQPTTSSYSQCYRDRSQLWSQYFKQY